MIVERAPAQPFIWRLISVEKDDGKQGRSDKDRSSGRTSCILGLQCSSPDPGARAGLSGAGLHQCCTWRDFRDCDPPYVGLGGERDKRRFRPKASLARKIDCGLAPRAQFRTPRSCLFVEGISRLLAEKV